MSRGTLLALALGAGILVIAGLGILGSLAKVNEPDPRGVRPQFIAERLKAQGIDVNVEEVLYIYMDVPTYIVRGKLNGLQPEWKREATKWSRKPRGVVLQENGIVGYSHWPSDSNPEPHFAEKWKAFAK